MYYIFIYCLSQLSRIWSLWEVIVPVNINGWTHRPIQHNQLKESMSWIYLKETELPSASQLCSTTLMIRRSRSTLLSSRKKRGQTEKTSIHFFTESVYISGHKSWCARNFTLFPSNQLWCLTAIFVGKCILISSHLTSKWLFGTWPVC